MIKPKSERNQIMQNKKIMKLLTLVLTLTVLAALALNTAALIDDPGFNNSGEMGRSNIPDNEIDRRSASTEAGSATDGATSRDTAKKDDHTGVVDDALDKASGAVESVKDDIEDGMDEAGRGSITGIVIAILIAVALVILIIVMVSKNGEKYNRK